MKQRGLGRGFDSLIPTEVTANLDPAVKPATGESIQQVDPAHIVPNPHQPRTTFNEDELKGLATSIKKHGILHPPVVSDTGNGIYELIAGERRVRAAKLAGLKKVPVIIRSFDEQQKLELALLENVQRAELNPIETALAYRKLSDEFNLTYEQIGERMGKSKASVSNSLRLLALPKTVLKAVAEGTISEAHGRTIASIEQPTEQQKLLENILSNGWSVRQAEEFARGVKTSVKTSSERPKKGSHHPNRVEANSYLTNELGTYLGTKVVLQPTAKGGRLLIEYYSDEELQRIFETIKPAE